MNQYIHYIKKYLQKNGPDSPSGVSPPRIAFYHRYEKNICPDLLSHQLSSTKEQLRLANWELQAVFQEELFEWSVYESLLSLASDFDLIITPDIHQFGDTLADAVSRIERIHCPVFFELEHIFSKNDPFFLLIEIALGNELLFDYGKYSIYEDDIAKLSETDRKRLLESNRHGPEETVRSIKAR